MHFAHSVIDRSQEEWQRLHHHLHNVAELAAGFSAGFGAQQTASLAGMLHDLGKYSAAFQARLSGGTPVDHATAGAKQAWELRDGSGPYDALMLELVAYIVAGHHTGLPDKIGGEGSLAERLVKQIEVLGPVWRSEISLAPTSLWPSEFKPQTNRANAAFQLSFLGRMIFSCLIDADRRDTESFCARHEGWTPDREWPQLSQAVDCLIDRLDRHMNGLRGAAPGSDVN